MDYFYLNVSFSNFSWSRYNVLDEDEIQGEEDGVSGMDGNVQVRLTNDQINLMPINKQKKKMLNVCIFSL